MRNLKHAVVMLLGGLCVSGQVQAHNVIWWENPSGYNPSTPMTFYYPQQYVDYFFAAPLLNEACTVVVNLNSINSTLVSASVIASPANRVAVRVLILRAPSNHLETATISGEWHATSLPTPEYCTAVTPNPFTVPITVSDQLPSWQINVTANGEWIMLDAGFNSALQYSSCITGPWANIGMGQTYSIKNDMREGFYQRTKQVGGFISGYINDTWGNPLSGLGMGLVESGPIITSDSGTYQFPRMPYGLNVISITNPAISAVLNTEILNTNNVVQDWVVDMEGNTNPPPTNVCDCTPWCAIGFGNGPAGQTPVYYSGGASQPKGSQNTCDAPVVTVTPPSGPPITIHAGTRGRQNSGPNPESGTWTVTAVVCGKTQTATVDVP
jgi:hypothetical protein